MRRGPHINLLGRDTRPSAWPVLGAMCRAVRKGDGLCFVGHRKLAADADVCPRTVRRCQSDFLELGIVHRYRSQVLPSGLCVQSTIVHVPSGVRLAIGLTPETCPPNSRSSDLVQKFPSETSAAQADHGSRAPPESGDGGELRGAHALRDPLREAVRRQRATFAVLARVTNANPRLERGVLNHAAKSIRDEHPELGTEALCREIERRGVIYRRSMPDMLLTPSGLAKHWRRLVTPKTFPRPTLQVAKDDRRWQNEVGWIDGPKELDLELRERLRERGLIAA